MHSVLTFWIILPNFTNLEISEFWSLPIRSLKPMFVCFNMRRSFGWAKIHFT